MSSVNSNFIPMLYITNAIDSLEIHITLSKHCHLNLLVHTGVVPVNERSALQVLVRSPAV